MPTLTRDDSQSLDDATAGGQSAGARTTHARVPRPLGMDFSLLPASTVAPLPSNKHAKESIKGRLTVRGSGAGGRQPLLTRSRFFCRHRALWRADAASSRSPQDRIGTSKRKVQAQATSLSIEGRGIDKL